MNAYCAGTHSYAMCVAPCRRPTTYGRQQQSRSYSCEQPLLVPLPVHPPVAARSTHLATPRTISTPIRCRQCPPQVIEDQWARSPTPFLYSIGCMSLLMCVAYSSIITNIQYVGHTFFTTLEICLIKIILVYGIESRY